MKTGPDPPPCRKCYTFFFFEGFPYLFLSKITMPEVFTLKEQGSQNTEQPQLHVWSRSEVDAKEDALPGRARSCFSFCLTVLSSAGLMARSVNVKITKASLLV